MVRSPAPHITLRIFLCISLISMLSLGFASLLYAAEPVEVRVEGIDGDPQRNVQEALAIPSGFIREGAVDRLWLEHFSRQAEPKVREAMEPFGFYASKVTTSLEGDEKDGFILLAKVTAGEQTRLEAAEVTLEGPGTAEAPLRDKIAAFPLRTGDPLLHDQYEKAKADLLVAARERGYLDADFSIHEIQVNPGAASARIRLVLATGPRYLFGPTKIEGDQYYDEELLRRYISYKEGEIFSYRELGKTQLNFASSSYFKSVSVLPDKSAAQELRVPVVITVAPAPRRTIRVGAGYGTDTGFRGSVSYKDLSLLHPGHTLSSELTVAQKLQGLGAVYTIPSTRNIDTFSSLQLNLQREDVNDILSKLVSLELARTTGFGNDRLGTAFIRLQYEQYSVGLQDTDSLLLLPGFRFSHRSYDDLIRPRKGFHYSLETRGTHRYLGSDASFVQFIGDAGWIIPLPWRLSLQNRGRAGTTFIDEHYGDLPTSLRFYAGGDSSVRGYGYKALGPKDSTGEVIGGRHLLQGTVELERALFDNWGVSLFYDAGNAFDVTENIHLYQGVGIGIHYYTPIGGINLSVARQIRVADPGFRVHFTIGFQL